MLNVKNLITEFDVATGTLKAVDGVSFEVGDNEIVGIVGESGSGKSVTAMSIMGLIPKNGRIKSGEIIYKGKNLAQFSEKEYRKIRGTEIGLIFQNPLASLNPVFTIANQMIETIRIHHPSYSKEKAREVAIDYLKKVNISDPEARLNQYPHEFSLGMCQRIMIAITLVMDPTLLIADEPTASLDVTIQAQILQLLKDIQADHNMSVLMISHDLGIMAQHCDKILVMYLGRIVEAGTPDQIFNAPQHPYTQALISAIPNPNPTIKHTPQILKGDIPSPINLPVGCRFQGRCPLVEDKCRKSEPALEIKNSRDVACWQV